MKSNRWLTIAALAALPLLAASTNGTKPLDVTERVRHELVMLPNLGVFDNLAFRVEGGRVTLFGAVVRPVLKSSAERVVAAIPGVTGVENRIEVLPLSRFDDQARFGVFRAVYSWPGLDRLAWQALPPVRIIVKNGHVALEGVVANEMDRNAAYVRALAVPGVFSVENHLTVERASR
jgi:hyperosmotically inducible protein